MCGQFGIVEWRSSIKLSKWVLETGLSILPEWVCESSKRILREWF